MYIISAFPDILKILKIMMFKHTSNSFHISQFEYWKVLFNEKKVCCFSNKQTMETVLLHVHKYLKNAKNI